jgi:hypothetical protein
MSPAMKLSEIASRIDAHLKRFEADPIINKQGTAHQKGLTPYYGAGSWSYGRYLRVFYITYQGGSILKRDAALKYLEWLDAGNVGRHYEALQEQK